MSTHRRFPSLSELRRDSSLSTFVAPFIANLAGYGGPLAIVIGAGQAARLSHEQMVSMLCALCVSFGLVSLLLSAWLRVPVITAWTTPGAAFLISALPSVSFGEAVAGFMIANGIIALIAWSGVFDAVMRRIPQSIASALLAGILFRFGLNIFTPLASQTTLIALMLTTYFVVRRFPPSYARYAILAVLLVGCGYVFGWQHTPMPSIPLHLAHLTWTMPEFSLKALLNIGLPLALITLTGQQITGIAVLRASGYDAAQAPAKPLVGWTALISVLTAPFGNFGVNLAAITAAICTDATCHPDPAKRYVAGIWYGGLNIVLGLFAGVLVAFFVALPQTFVLILAGMALLNAILSNITQAFYSSHSASDREAGLMTFMVCVSGATLWQLGSAFWAIALGCAVYALHHASTWWLRKE